MRRTRTAPSRPSATSVLAHGREYDGLVAVRHGGGEADRGLRSWHRTPEECQLEPFVAQHCRVGVVGDELEAVDRNAVQTPAAAADADVAGCDVPAILI